MNNIIYLHQVPVCKFYSKEFVPFMLANFTYKEDYNFNPHNFYHTYITDNERLIIILKVTSQIYFKNFEDVAFLKLALKNII